jgi:hypothetical protein
MITTENILALAQDEIQGLLAADEYFVDVPVVSDDDHELRATVRRALGVITTQALKRGACAVVMLPVAEDALPNAAPSQLRMSLVVRVCENPMVNRGATGTNKRASTLARRVSRLLKCHGAAGVFKLLVPARPHIVPVDDPYAPVAFEVVFEADEDDPGTITRVAVPAIVSTNRCVTITCGTAGATIYYSIDGTSPFAVRTLYRVMFPVAANTRVRAGAIKTGMLPSNSVYLDVT